jgi:hypothetical protein
MANQTIALQARAPQSDPLGGAIRNNAQMINMMAQQQAAQRQNAIAEQTMQIQRAKEARETAMAGPQLAEAQSKAGSARMDFALKALGRALHTSVNNPTDETLDRAAMTLAEIGLNPAEIDRELSPIKQLPLEQRKGALMQSILSDPDSKAAFEATLPKLVEVRRGDRIDQLDKNPLSSTFNQVVRSDMVGMTPAQANPAGRLVQDDQGNYILVNTRSAGSTPVMAGGGEIPAGRGGASALTTNPGALKDGAFARSQPGYAGARGAFATFDTPEAGVRAQENLLRSAYVGKGFNTIDKIVNRYAPPGPENSGASVSNYKSYIAQRTGLDVNAPISPAQVPAVAAAMREFETGQRPGAAPAAGAGQLKGPVKGEGTATASAQAYNAMEATTAKYDGTIERAKRLLNNPALDTIIGNVQGNIPEMALSLYSQEAANALSDYNELLAVAGFQELQAMRDASPTGGALGQVSDSENKLLQQSAFASSRTQDETKFRQSLRNYIKRLEDSKRRVEGAYERTFGGRFAPGGAAPAAAGGAPKRLKFNPATGDFD